MVLKAASHTSCHHFACKVKKVCRSAARNMKRMEVLRKCVRMITTSQF